MSDTFARLTLGLTSKTAMHAHAASGEIPKYENISFERRIPLRNGMDAHVYWQARPDDLIVNYARLHGHRSDPNLDFPVVLLVGWPNGFVTKLSRLFSSHLSDHID